MLGASIMPWCDSLFSGPKNLYFFQLTFDIQLESLFLQSLLIQN